MFYYICRRAFRDARGPVPVGTVVVPTGIKRFRYRLQQKHIIEVNKQNFEQYQHLFKVKFGIDIPTLEEPVKEEPVKEESVKEEPVKEEPVKEEPVKAKVKATPIKR